MATEKEIRETILRIAGNPSVGAIVDLADDLAAAIVELDAPPVRGKKPDVETRVLGSSETR
jgi:hypothetical protein